MVPARPVSISGIIQPGIGIRFSFWLGISASFAEIVSVISITMIPSWPVSVGGIVQPSVSIRLSF